MRCGARWPAALRRLGIRGCAAEVAGDFGDHPDVAVTRMTWALAMVRTYRLPGERRRAAQPVPPGPGWLTKIRQPHDSWISASMERLEHDRCS
jgi:hypothetical protein